MLNEDQFRFREDRRIDGNVIKGGTAHFLIVHAEGRITFQSAGRLHTVEALREHVIRILRLAAAEGDDMRTFVFLQHHEGRAVQARVRQSHHLEIPFLEHRAVIAGTERFDRTARLARALVNTAGGKRKTEFVVGLPAYFEIVDRKAHMVEFKG